MPAQQFRELQNLYIERQITDAHASRAPRLRLRLGNGDALAPLLLECFAGIQVEWAPPARARVVSIGSLLDRLPTPWAGYIVGSGKMHQASRLDDLAQTAKILLLRGPLTARGLPGTFRLGDPAILASELVGEQEKQWDLGVALA